MTTVYLAYTHGRSHTLTDFDLDVNVLVAAQEMAGYRKNHELIKPRRLMIDSGAFAAWNSGYVITYDEWRKNALEWPGADVFSLDVIYKPDESLDNYKRALDEGIDCIPTFHYESPWRHLENLLKMGVPWIALGGMTRVHHKRRLEWLSCCFSIGWPQRFHGFGLTDPKILRLLPFWTVDSSAWSLAPAGFGVYRGMGNNHRPSKIPAKAQKYFRTEVAFHQRLERELTAGNQTNPQELLKVRFECNTTSMVAVRNVPFVSVCEHHFLPFLGTALVAYVPNLESKQVVGLSKIARLVRCLAKRLQIQEMLTEQIADALHTALDATGVGVRIESQHTCMKCRGVESEGTMVTQALRGNFMTNPVVRAEFMDLHR